MRMVNGVGLRSEETRHNMYMLAVVLAISLKMLSPYAPAFNVAIGDWGSGINPGRRIAVPDQMTWKP